VTAERDQQAPAFRGAPQRILDDVIGTLPALCWSPSGGLTILKSGAAVTGGTGADVRSKYKETALGGLAVNVPLC